VLGSRRGPIRRRCDASENQQLGALGNGQRQRQLSPLPSREGASPLTGIQVELFEPTLCEVAVPGRVHVRPEPEMVNNPQPGIEGSVLGDETDPGDLRASGGWCSTKDCDRARRRRQQARGQRVQGCFAGPVWSNQPDDPTRGIARVQSDSTHRLP